MPPQDRAHYNIDWIFSNTSDAHVANRREWFTNYVAFSSETTSLMGGSMEVVGVGDVKLLVNTPTPSGQSQTSAPLVLKDVLHCPKGICNIVGLLAMDEDFEMQLGDADHSWLRDPRTGTVYLMDIVKPWKLWLAGQAKGQTSLDMGGAYYINANWAEEERERFEAYRKEREGEVIAGLAVEGQDVDGVGGNKYSEVEKKWIKEHYGNEWKFLTQHGLKMHEEGDREEGRRIVRALMREDD